MTSAAVPVSDERPLTTQDWIGFIGLVFGMFMSIMDIQIVNSSLEQIQAGLSATTDEITWVQTSYLIAEVIMIPLSGWLARAFSTRYLFLFSCGGFTVMSFACALSWNLTSMIVFRAMQGFFGGAMIPTVFAVIFTVFPRRLQSHLSILVGLVVTLAPTTGPVLGGYLTDTYSWHAMFLINIIPGLCVCATTWLYVHVDQPDWSLLKKIDYPGIILVALFLGCLQYVLEEGTRNDWFASTEIILLTAVSSLSALAFIYRELSASHPVIELRAYKNGNFLLGSVYGFIVGWGLYTVVYLFPLYLGMIKGLNSFQIGVYMTVTGIFQFLSAPLAGILMGLIDARMMLMFGLSCFGLSTWFSGHLTNEWGYWEFFLPQTLRGLSLLFCMLPINMIALSTLPPDQVKNASGLYNLMRNLGGAVGLAVINTKLSSWIKVYYAQLRENLTPANPQAQQFLENMQQKIESVQNGDSEMSALKMLNALTQREATILAFNDTFMLMSFFFLASLFLIPFIKKIPLGSAPSEAH